MTALSSTTGAPPIRENQVPPGTRTMQPRGASTTFYTAGGLCHRAGSDLVEHPSASAPRTDLITAGILVGTAVSYTTGPNVDSAGGALDANGYPASLTMSNGTIGWFDTASGADLITNENLDQVCYWIDNNTLGLTSGNGTRSAAGYVADWRATASATSACVKLRIDPSVYLTNADPLPASTQELTARGVITALGAYTGAGTGVLTVTATGALGAQDGLTAVAGQIFHLPVYTGTANSSVAVLPADSGPYEITTLGATGVSAVLTRPAKWAHGATIVQETLVKVGPEGTLFKNTKWYAAPAGLTKVVGTDDPGLYPDRVTQSIVLSSGVLAVTNVPLRPASGAGAGLASAFSNVTTLTTATGTVSYGLTGGYTPGALGTSSMSWKALLTAQAINTGDGSTLNLTIIQ